MRLGISTYTFTWSIGVIGYYPEHPLGWRGLLGKAKDLGVDLIQVADNLPLDTLPQEEIFSFQNQAKDSKISIEVGTRGIGINHLRRYLDLAIQFESPLLRLVVDSATDHPSPSEVIKTLKDLVPDLENAHVVLAIENHDRFKAKTLVEIMDSIGSPSIGICLDTVNSFGALEGPEFVVQMLGPYVVNLHIKDFTIFRANHMMGYTLEGRPAGKGMLDVPNLLTKLVNTGRNPNAILELWTPPEPELQATILKENAWAAESIMYLQPLIEKLKDNASKLALK